MSASGRTEVHFCLAVRQRLLRQVSPGACFRCGKALAACLRAWRLGLGLAIGFPVAAGWPLLVWFRQPGYRSWLQGIAIPWWIVLGVTALMILITKVSSEAGLRADASAAEARCTTCAPAGGGRH